MNHYSTNKTGLSSLLLLSLLWLLTTQLQAGQLKLQPYKAIYNVTIDNIEVAQAELSLKQFNSLWHWGLKLEPIGIFRLLTNKAPHSQTDFQLQDNRLKVQSSVSSKSGEIYAEDSARTYFDWSAQKLHYQKKTLSHSLPIKDEIYNYDTIYWLAAKMADQQQNSRQVDFYYKGKLGRSTLKYLGETVIQIQGKQHQVKHFSHTQTLSKNRFDYYLDDHRLVPLKIVKTRKKKKTVMIRLSIKENIASDI